MRTASLDRNLDTVTALLRAVWRGTQERAEKLPAEMREWGADVSRKLLASKKEADVRTGVERMPPVSSPWAVAWLAISRGWPPA